MEEHLFPTVGRQDRKGQTSVVFVGLTNNGHGKLRGKDVGQLPLAAVIVANAGDS